MDPALADEEDEDERIVGAADEEEDQDGEGAVSPLPPALPATGPDSHGAGVTTPAGIGAPLFSAS